jgi:hypothetical protein
MLEFSANRVMFITTHAVLGALIAQQVPGNAFAAFVLGMASHFISDIMPHGDTNLYKDYVSGRRVKSSIAYVTIDGILTVIVCFVYFQPRFRRCEARYYNGNYWWSLARSFSRGLRGFPCTWL